MNVQKEIKMSPWYDAYCLLDKSLPPIYLFLSCIAIASLVIPFLRDLALHGKSRSSSATANNDNRLCHELLYGEAFLVPKQFFLHFYFTGLLSTVVTYTYAKYQGGSGQNDLAIALLIAHLLRRFLECRYVHAWSPTSRMHLAGYALGIIHYLILPLVFMDPVCDEFLAKHSSDWRIALLGTGTCLWAQYEQNRHHCLLARLRIGRDGVDTTQDYRIPTKGWFRIISCPHYLAEIIIYISFALMLRSDTSHDLTLYQSITLVVWVATNLSVSAIQSHDWYLLQFPEYAALQRKAIFPFLL
jgi:3-oxo-5-alpha-steroid 4-dehydrogenase 3